MNDLLPFLTVGLATGSVFGLAALGLTLTFKTSGLFNFSHGAVAACAAFAFSSLHVDHDVPWPVAIVVVVVGVGVIFGLGIEWLSRQTSADPTDAIVLTVGLLLALQGLIAWTYGPSTRAFEPYIRGDAFTVSSVAIANQQVAAVVAGTASCVLLWLFFTRTRLGAAMRAVVAGAELLSLTGLEPNRVRAIAWVLGSMFAALSGVLIAPFVGLDSLVLTLLVVQACGAVAIGRFSSLPLTYLGGIALGVGASLLTKWLSDHPSLSGLPSSLPFLVLLVALVGAPPRRTNAFSATLPVSEPRPLPTRVLVVGTPVVVAALVALPWIVGVKLPLYTRGLALVIAFLSLSLLVHLSGQLSLCHMAFVGVGATSFCHLASSSGPGLPWLVAVTGGALSVVPLGLAVAIPAIRLSGIYLALATFGLGILIERVLYPMESVFGSAGYQLAQRPGFAQTDRAYYFLALAVVVVTAAGVVLLSRSRLGRLLRGLRESPVGLATNGLGLHATRLTVFAIAAAMAGLAGAIEAGALGSVGSSSYGSIDSLFFLVVLAVAGRRIIGGAAVAAAAVAVLPGYVPAGLVTHQPLIFGAAAIVVVVGRHVTVVPGRARGRLATSPVRARASSAAARLVAS